MLRKKPGVRAEHQEQWHSWMRTDRNELCAFMEVLSRQGEGATVQQFASIRGFESDAGVVLFVLPLWIESIEQSVKKWNETWWKVSNGFYSLMTWCVGPNILSASCPPAGLAGTSSAAVTASTHAVPQPVRGGPCLLDKEHTRRKRGGWYTNAVKNTHLNNNYTRITKFLEWICTEMLP